MTILEFRAIKLSKSCFNSYIIFNPINMRNIKIVLLSIGMISLIACSSDDDDLTKNANCYDCAANIVALVPAIDYCDNADGTVDVTSLGITKTVDLQGVSFEEFIAGVKLLTNCTKN